MMSDEEKEKDPNQEEADQASERWGAAFFWFENALVEWSYHARAAKEREERAKCYAETSRASHVATYTWHFAREEAAHAQAVYWNTKATLEAEKARRQGSKEAHRKAEIAETRAAEARKEAHQATEARKAFETSLQIP